MPTAAFACLLPALGHAGARVLLCATSSGRRASRLSATPGSAEADPAGAALSEAEATRAWVGSGIGRRAGRRSAVPPNLCPEPSPADAALDSG